MAPEPVDPRCDAPSPARWQPAAAWIHMAGGTATIFLDDRVAALEAATVVTQQAIAGLTSRIVALEGRQ